MAYNEWHPMRTEIIQPGQAGIIRGIKDFLKHPIGVDLFVGEFDERFSRFEVIGNDLRYIVGEVPPNAVLRAEICASRVVDEESIVSPMLLDFEVRIPVEGPTGPPPSVKRAIVEGVSGVVISGSTSAFIPDAEDGDSITGPSGASGSTPSMERFGDTPGSRSNVGVRSHAGIIFTTPTQTVRLYDGEDGENAVPGGTVTGPPGPPPTVMRTVVDGGSGVSISGVGEAFIPDPLPPEPAITGPSGASGSTPSMERFGDAPDSRSSVGVRSHAGVILTTPDQMVRLYDGEDGQDGVSPDPLPPLPAIPPLPPITGPPGPSGTPPPPITGPTGATGPPPFVERRTVGIVSGVYISGTGTGFIPDPLPPLPPITGPSGPSGHTPSMERFGNLRSNVGVRSHAGVTLTTPNQMVNLYDGEDGVGTPGETVTGPTGPPPSVMRGVKDGMSGVIVSGTGSGFIPDPLPPEPAITGPSGASGSTPSMERFGDAPDSRSSVGVRSHAGVILTTPDQMVRLYDGEDGQDGVSPDPLPPLPAIPPLPPITGPPGASGTPPPPITGPTGATGPSGTPPPPITGPTGATGPPPFVERRTVGIVSGVYISGTGTGFIADPLPPEPAITGPSGSSGHTPSMMRFGGGSRSSVGPRSHAGVTLTTPNQMVNLYDGEDGMPGESVMGEPGPPPSVMRGVMNGTSGVIISGVGSGFVPDPLPPEPPITGPSGATGHTPSMSRFGNLRSNVGVRSHAGVTLTTPDQMVNLYDGESGEAGLPGVSPIVSGNSDGALITDADGMEVQIMHGEAGLPGVSPIVSGNPDGALITDADGIEVQIMHGEAGLPGVSPIVSGNPDGALITDADGTMVQIEHGVAGLPPTMERFGGNRRDIGVRSHAGVLLTTADQSVNLYDGEDGDSILGPPPSVMRTVQGGLSGVIISGVGEAFIADPEDGDSILGPPPSVMRTVQGGLSGVIISGVGEAFIADPEDGDSILGPPPSVMRTVQGGLSGVIISGVGEAFIADPEDGLQGPPPTVTEGSDGVRISGFGQALIPFPEDGLQGPPPTVTELSDGVRISGVGEAFIPFLEEGEGVTHSSVFEIMTGLLRSGSGLHVSKNSSAETISYRIDDPNDDVLIRIVYEVMTGILSGGSSVNLNNNYNGRRIIINYT